MVDFFLLILREVCDLGRDGEGGALLDVDLLLVAAVLGAIVLLLHVAGPLKIELEKNRKFLPLYKKGNRLQASGYLAAIA